MSPYKNFTSYFHWLFLSLVFDDVVESEVSLLGRIESVTWYCFVGGPFWDRASLLRAHIGLEPRGLPVFSFLSTLSPECVGYFFLEYSQTICLLKKYCVHIYDVSFSLDMLVICFHVEVRAQFWDLYFTFVMRSGVGTGQSGFLPQVLHHTGPPVIKPLLKEHLIHLFKKIVSFF